MMPDVIATHISSRIEKIKVDNLVSDVGCTSGPLDVCDDIISRTEQNKVDGPIDLWMIISRVP